MKGNLEIAKLLLSSGSKTGHQSGFSLIQASRYGYLDIVKELIHHGDDPNAKDIDDYTPLHYAAKNGHNKVVRFLLKNGSKTNAKSKSLVFVFIKKPHFISLQKKVTSK